MSEEKYNEEEGMDNTTALSHILDSGDIEEVRTLLGDRDQVRHAGIIRGGIKVPKKNCTKQEIALFHKLEAEGLPYDEIDRQINGKPRSAGSKLFPQNADFLVVRACDFKRPADAEYILKKYADPDGKVRRLPVWLTSSDIDKVLPHSFRAFGGDGSLRAISFYKNGALTCRYVPKDVKVPKKEDWRERPCDPDNCPEVSGKKCQFGGMFKVNVPGLKTMGNVIIPTRSWNGIKFSCGLLNTVRGLLGRFDGLFKGEPFLELVKSEELVNTPEGKRKQQIITLELAIDPMELARYAESKAERGIAAMQLFNGSAHPKNVTHQTSTDFVPPAQSDEDLPPFASDSAPAAGEPEPEPAPGGEVDPAVAKAQQYIVDMAAYYELNMDHVRAYAAQVSGGVCFEDLPVEDLRSLAASFKRRATADLPKLVWDLQSAADALAVASEGQ